MKITLLIFLLILALCQSNAQLQIDAGDDLIICLDEIYPDLPTLGGNPTALSGEEPYTYIWSTQYERIFWASSFLDDTTSANPRLTSIAHPRLMFYLTVIDGGGVVEKDSINLRFSRYGYTDLYFYTPINRGDTMNLYHNICSFEWGYENLNFTWSPNYNISDTSVCCPQAWPDSTMAYTVIAIDSLGCMSFPDVIDVYVNPPNVSPSNIGVSKAIILPNPVDESSILTIDCAQDDLTIKIFNASGQLIISDILHEKTYKIGSIINESGFYFYTISRSNEILAYGQFVKK
jgi:hypothetical protein